MSSFLHAFICPAYLPTKRISNWLFLWFCRELAQLVNLTELLNFYSIYSFAARAML